jgi:hypothetical protein
LQLPGWKGLEGGQVCAKVNKCAPDCGEFANWANDRCVCIKEKEIFVRRII